MKEWIAWLEQILQGRLARHLVFWIGMFFINYTFYTLGQYESFTVFIVNLLSLLPAQLMAAYLMVYVLIPRLIFRKKYVLFWLSFLITGYIFLVLTRTMTIYMVEAILERGYPKDGPVEILTNIRHLMSRYFLVVYFPTLVMVLIHTVLHRAKEIKQIDTLQIEKTTAELNFLKAQIHPHFLFNTLNNLYALTLRKSDAAPEVVLKLSSMLDYMLYQCKGPTVPIYKEIQLIENYIELELLRYGNRLDLTFEHEVDDPQVSIAPMILLSFVENAFKHGASGDIDQPRVHISLRVRQSHLQFTVFNTKSPIKQRDEADFRKGIGQGNIQRQLELLYAGRNELVIESTDDTYSTHLSIDL